LKPENDNEFCKKISNVILKHLIFPDYFFFRQQKSPEITASGLFYKIFFYSIAFFLSLAYNMFKGTTAHKGLTGFIRDRNTTLNLSKFLEGGFSML